MKQITWEALDGADDLPVSAFRRQHKGKNAWSQTRSNPPEQPHSHTFVLKKPLLAIVAHRNNMSALTGRAWHEKWCGSYCHSVIALFNQTFQRWYIVGPQRDCSFLRYGPGLQGQHVGVWSATRQLQAHPDKKWWPISFTSLHSSSSAGLANWISTLVDGVRGAQRRPSFLFTKWDTPIISKDQVSAHRVLWCS